MACFPGNRKPPSFSGGRNCIMLSMGKETEDHGESWKCWTYLDMLIGSYWILLDLIGSYWILLDLIGSYWILLDLGWWWCVWSHHTELPGSEEVSDSRRLWRSWIESNDSDVFSQDCLKSAGWGTQGIGFTDKLYNLWIYKTCDRTSCGACPISR